MISVLHPNCLSIDFANKFFKIGNPRVGDSTVVRILKAAGIGKYNPESHYWVKKKEFRPKGYKEKNTDWTEVVFTD